MHEQRKQTYDVSKRGYRSRDAKQKRSIDRRENRQAPRGGTECAKEGQGLPGAGVAHVPGKRPPQELSTEKDQTEV